MNKIEGGGGGYGGVREKLKRQNVAFILFIHSVLKLFKSDMHIFSALKVFVGTGVSQFAFGMRLVCVWSVTVCVCVCA